ncbi:MAG: hypothetical protein ABEK42_03640 [Thiohalorhabdaceae bacterium]
MAGAGLPEDWAAALRGLGLDPERLGGMTAGFLDYVQAGGLVMPPLILSAVLLWFGLGYRISALRWGDRRDVRLLLREYAQSPPRRTKGVVDEAVVDLGGRVLPL